MRDSLTRLGVRAALIGSSLANGSTFWARAALGTNQLKMHECRHGEISIGGVSEQMYGEGYLAAWHEVLGRELGPRAAQILYEVGKRGGSWESAEAIRRQVWVPPLLRPFIGRPELLRKARESDLYHALIQETMRILIRMIMTEGGWGVVREIAIRETPLRVVLENTPEPRRLGHTGEVSCHLLAGTFAGYCETMLGAPVAVRESTCASRGDPECTFELTVSEEVAS